MLNGAVEVVLEELEDVNDPALEELEGVVSPPFKELDGVFDPVVEAVTDGAAEMAPLPMVDGEPGLEVGLDNGPKVGIEGATSGPAEVSVATVADVASAGPVAATVGGGDSAVVPNTLGPGGVVTTAGIVAATSAELADMTDATLADDSTVYLTWVIGSTVPMSGQLEAGIF